MLLGILKTVGGPGSLGFFVVSIAAGFILMRTWPRTTEIGRRWIVTVATVYFLLSLPWVAWGLAHHLPTVAKPSVELSGLRCLVVLDGDNRDGRAREAGRVYAMVQPETIWVLGGAEIAASIVAAGVPVSRLRIESLAPTTRAQVNRVQSLVGSNAAEVGVIASRLQMPRVEALMRTARARSTLIASSLDKEPPTAGPWLVIPSLAALTLSRDVLYEHAALAYYRWRGWI